MIDPKPVVDLIYAFRRSNAMFAGVVLGVFDVLHDRWAGADAFPANAGASERLLNACVALGLLEKRGDQYRNTPLASEYLRRSSPRTLAGYILYSNAALFPMWAKLEDAVREGSNRWEPTFGFKSDKLFEHYFKTEESKRDFILGMHGFGLLSSPKVVEAFDLSGFRRLVDLGGATGHLTLAAIERYPALRAAVFDLPGVIAVAREFTGDRVELIAGDFFADELPASDLYALGRILHDWSEDKIRPLLAKIHAGLPPRGALLIAESLLDEDKTAPVDTLLQSLNMLVCTEGKERTLSEYTSLLREAGFAEVRSKRTGAPLDAILALKGN
jgi:acetylserotonin O-methyltransferase